jgi:hypothetical protein
MTDRGEIPVEYRGTHRRIRLAAIMAWLDGQKRKQAAVNAADGTSDGGTSDGGTSDGGTSAGGNGQ